MEQVMEMNKLSNNSPC